MTNKTNEPKVPIYEEDDLQHRMTSPNAAISLSAKNTFLTNALKTTRSRVREIQARLDALTVPPLQFGTVSYVDPEMQAKAIENAALLAEYANADLGAAAGEDYEKFNFMIDVLVGGRPLRVGVDTEVDPGSLQAGDRVLLNEELVVIERLNPTEVGEIVPVKEVLPDGRLLVGGRGGNERVVTPGGSLREHAPKPGETVVADLKADVAVAVVDRSDIEELILEDIPDTDFSDIGGLGEQIEQIRDAIELPFHHPELYRDYGLRAPKGILLYGPPGCGKTLIAKAIATSLTDARRAQAGTDAAAGSHAQRSYFLNVKGPELLNKFVGETERQIRLMFAGAREKALAGRPVVIFFDEMESLFRTRGTGRSSDVETTVVPQLLAEIDGVEELDNVIVVGASNREDMIDPAILRPGRLDVKIRIERPDADAAREIFAIYLTPDLPLHADELAANGGDPQATVNAMIEATVEAMYERTERTEYLEVTYADGAMEVLYIADFASGAMIANIVNRAKKAAIKATLDEGQPGLRTSYLIDAMRTEARENEHLPSAADPDEWARVSGRRGERVVNLRTIGTEQRAADAEAAAPSRSVGEAEPTPGASEAEGRDVTDIDTGGLL